MAARGARAAVRSDATGRGVDRHRGRYRRAGPTWGLPARTSSLGWTEGRNVQIVARFAPNDPERRAFSGELVGLAPDVILANTGAVARALLQATKTIPIVFAQLPDPVADGLVSNLARPGGNITGFTSFEYAMGGKWLELLKEIAPGVMRVLVVGGVRSMMPEVVLPENHIRA